MQIKNKFIQIQDRRLGDEWKNWRGDLDPCVQNAETGKRIFLLLLLLAILTSCILGIGFWYLISPRLKEIKDGLPGIVLVLWLAVCGILFIWFSLITVSLFFEKNLLFRFGRKKLSITFVLPFILRLGKKLGIPHDRMAHSFVQVSNALIGIRPGKIKPKSILILLPRCLEKTLLRKILSFSKRKNIPVYVVPGGELARRLIMEKQPRAVIGVACERDLLSGIKDLKSDIPVIGIPNIRPEGPCKNTRIDFQKLEKAVNTFMGIQDKASILHT